MNRYYKMLESDKSDSIEEIKKKYKILAKKYHPDMEGGSEELFVNLKKSLDIVTNTPYLESLQELRKQQRTTPAGYKLREPNEFEYREYTVSHINMLDLYTKQTKTAVYLNPKEYKEKYNIELGNLRQLNIFKDKRDGKLLNHYRLVIDDLELFITLKIEPIKYKCEYFDMYLKDNLDVVIELKKKSKTNYCERKIEVDLDFSDINQNQIFKGLGLTSGDLEGDLIVINKIESLKETLDEATTDKKLKKEE